MRMVAKPASSASNRINERLLAYWLKAKGTRLFPNESDINPDELADIWADCFLVKVDHETGAAPYHYIYLGSSLAEAYGDDLSNREVCEKLVYPSSMSLSHKFDEIVKTNAPANDEGEFTNTRNLLIKYRSCMLPLGNSEGKLQFIIGGMKWKAF